MPGKDKTGPLGEGPATGRGLGPCGRLSARRYGLGSGRGRLYKGFAPENTIDLSRDEQKRILEAEKQEIEKRLKELE